MDQIVDYGTLKAAVKEYTHRTDLDARIPIFCLFGIGKINRECYSVHQEQEAELTVNAGTTLIALPTGYKEMRSVTCGGVPLTQLSLNQKDRDFANVGTTPTNYILADNRLTIHPSPSAEVTLKMSYYDTVILSDDTDTHPLLLANPNIFVYAAMREAAPFLQDEMAARGWGELLAEEIISENNMSEISRWSGSPLKIQPQMVTP